MSQTKAQLISDLVQSLAFTATSSAPDNGLYLSAANTLSFNTNAAASPRLTIDSSGNVGIGTDSPAVAFEVQSASNTTIRIDNEDDSTAQLYFHNTGSTDMDISVSSASMTFNHGASERARIDSSGRLLVGAESFTGNTRLVVRGNSSADNGGGNFYLVRGESSADMSNSDVVGVIRFGDQDDNRSAQIRSLIDGTPSATSMPGNLSFWTTEAGAVVPTERMTIDSDGNVGIGETEPGELLSLSQDVTTEANLLSLTGTSFADGEKIFTTFKRGTANLARIGVEATGSGTTGHLIFETALSGTPTERARINNSGRLLVGHSIARNHFFNDTVDNYNGNFQVESTGGLGRRVTSIVHNSDDQYSPILVLGKSRTDATGGVGLVSNADNLGMISFQGADGDGLVEAARIDSRVDGTAAADDMPAYLRFFTNSGASSATERMSITSEGFICADQTTRLNKADATSNTGGFKFQASSGDSTVRCEGFTSSTSERFHISFTNGNGIVGSISTEASATAFNTSSDYRLKENVTAVTDGITRLQQLKPSRFNFIADPDKTVDGFIAHEAAAVVPEAVTGEKDAVDDEGNPQYQGIDQSKLVPLLTAALQEAIAKIESLEARLTAAGL